MTKGTLVDDLKLPAVRNAGALAEYQETPGSRLMEFLSYLHAELMGAVETLREETREQLAEGDASSKIQAINRLRMRHNRIEAHLHQEVRNVRELTRSLRGQSDKAILDTLSKESANVLDEVGRALRDLVSEFGLVE